MTTVGFREVQPLTAAGKVFTVISAKLREVSDLVEQIGLNQLDTVLDMSYPF